jgi:hypothetical protein
MISKGIPIKGKKTATSPTTQLGIPPKNARIPFHAVLKAFVILFHNPIKNADTTSQCLTSKYAPTATSAIAATTARIGAKVSHNPAPRERPFLRTSNAKQGLRCAKTLLNREVSAEGSGQQWVYLTVEMDRYDRAIIGWGRSAPIWRRAHTTVAALIMSFKNRPAQDGLVFHSDRGCSIAPGRFAYVRRTVPNGPPEYEP